MRAIVAWTVVALTLLSLWWTTFKSRRLMSRSLGRKLKAGEETSLRSWMEYPRQDWRARPQNWSEIHSNASGNGGWPKWESGKTTSAIHRQVLFLEQRLPRGPGGVAAA